MQRFHISFKFLLLSLAVSFIVNGAVVYLMLFNFSHRSVLKTDIGKKIILVDMVGVLHKKRKKEKLNIINRQQSEAASKNYIKPKRHIEHKKGVKHQLSTGINNKKIILIKHRKIKKFHKKPFGKLIVLRRTEEKTDIKQAAKKADFAPKNVNSSTHLLKIQKTSLPIIHISSNSYSNIFLWISKHKFYPMEALYRGEKGKIGLSFVIKHSGFIDRIDILKPSEFKSLNKAAMKIVENSSPIPKSILESIIHFPAKATINISFRIE